MTYLLFFYLFLGFFFNNCWLVLAHSYDTENVTKGTDLLLTFVIHRHGDRTPIQSMLYLSEDSERDIKLSYPFGDGGLTNIGKMRGYQIGKYLRERYNNMLSDLYFEEEIYLRSTNVQRTKMTVLSALAAMYPPVKLQDWMPGFIWQPIPYFTLPVEDDFLSIFENCNNSELENFLEANITMNQHKELLELLTNHTTVNFTRNSINTYLYHDLIVSQLAIGVSPPKWLQPHMQKLSDAADDAIRIIFRSKTMKRLFGGVFLNEFITVASAIIAGREVNQRVRIYSAHDINVVAEMAAALVPFASAKYGSVFALELRRHRNSRQYVVAPVHLPQAGVSSASVLRVKGSDKLLCDFNIFKRLVAGHLLTEEQLKVECQ